MHKNIVIISCLLFLLLGCGKKGSLYLPDDKKQNTTNSEQTQ